MSHIEEGTLHAYLDGECAEQERASIEDHLAGCDACRERLDRARRARGRASELLATVEPGPSSAPAWREIEARAAARRSAAERRTWLRPSLAWAATLALAFTLGWYSRAEWADEPLARVLQRAEAPAATAELDDASAAEPAVADRPAAPDLRTEPSGPSAELGARKAELTAAKRGEADAREAEAAQAETRPPEPAEAELAETEASRRRREARVARDAEAARPLAERAAEQQPVSRRPLADRAAPTADALDESARAFGEGQQGAANLSIETGARGADRFLAVAPEDAAIWLGASPRTLPGLSLRRVDVGPGSEVPGGAPGRAAVRMVYADTAGREIALVQQFVGPSGPEPESTVTRLLVEPTGRKGLVWEDGDGYRLVLVGPLSRDSLTALAARVR